MYNFEALGVAFLIALAIMCFFLGIHYIKKKEININKFKPFQNLEKEEKLTYYDKILKKTKVPVRIALILIIIGAIICSLVAYIVTATIWITLVAGLGGFLVPQWWYKWTVSTNKKIMLNQMEQASEIMAAVLKTGSSLPDAMERAAQEIQEPLRAELIKCATQIRIGVSSSAAFMEFSQNVNIPEMKIVSIAIDLQETGMAINTPNLFLQLQSDIRHKAQFTKEVQTITAELKSAGYIVACVPFIVITAMRLISPDFTDPLFNQPLGLAIFLTCGGLIFIGLKWMLSVTKLEEK